MLERIVYSSLAREPVTEEMLAGILDHARRKNEQAQLTGVLIAHEDRFFQVLEGPTEALDACLARIGADSRHSRMRLLSREVTQTRMFGNWRMGYAAPDRLQVAARDAVFSIYALTGDGTRSLEVDNKVARLTRSFLSSFGLMGLAGRNAARAADLDGVGGQGEGVRQGI